MYKLYTRMELKKYYIEGPENNSNFFYFLTTLINIQSQNFRI